MVIDIFPKFHTMATWVLLKIGVIENKRKSLRAVFRFVKFVEDFQGVYL